MAWRKITEADLTAALSQLEIAGFRKSSDFEHDPVEELLASVTAKVRGYIRASRTVALNPDEATIPEALVSDAIAIVRYEVLTRQNLVVNESRTKAYDDANATLKEVAGGKFTVEPGVTPTPDNAIAAPSISVKPPIL